jgi:acyl carrier protein
MTDREILATIEEVARESLGYQGHLQPDMRVVEDVGLDSLELLSLAMDLEERFGVTLEGIAPSSVERVADLVGAIGRKLDR